MKIIFTVETEDVDTFENIRLLLGALAQLPKNALTRYVLDVLPE